MRIERLREDHVTGLVGLLPAGSYIGDRPTPQLARELVACGGWAAVDRDILAIGGIFHMRPGTGHAWMWMARGWRRHARAITAEVLAVLAESGLRRVEAAVRCDFAPGHRWIRALGFECEAERMKAWGPEGDDFALYARVRHG